MSNAKIDIAVQMLTLSGEESSVFGQRGIKREKEREGEGERDL